MEDTKEGSRADIREEYSVRKYLSPVGVWALSVGSAIGWGSFVFTGNQYLLKAGPAGSIIGMFVGAIIMLIMGKCYSILMRTYPDNGGIYSYITAVFGYDRAFLAAWFLFLTYISVLWANATSLPLFARNFFGTTFRFGAQYEVLGYEVYLGEALLSMAFVILIGLLCIFGSRLINVLITLLVVTFTAFILICTLVCLIRRDTVTISFSPAFIQGKGVFGQVLGIACLAPWAFVGFENISHSVEEFDFEHDRIDRIISSSVLVTTLLYIAIIVLSLCSHPRGYVSWIDYISDLDNLSGLARYPTFHAAQRYLGNIGVLMLAIALLSLVLSSLVGMMTALSRLMYALGKDEIIPVVFSDLTSKGVPYKSLIFLITISCIVPFVGRTAIGWIVDVTTIGTILVYCFVAAAVIKVERKEGNRRLETVGWAGIIIMLFLAIMVQLPNFTNDVSMAKESYFIFTIWGVLGFIFFRGVVNHDITRRFGNSMMVWIGMLALVLFTSLTWMAESTRSSAIETAMNMKGFYASGGADTELDEEEFLDMQLRKMTRLSNRNNSVVFGLFVLSTLTIMSNYSTMKKRERENDEALSQVQSMAFRDQLTGVKSKHAYVMTEESINRRIMDGLIDAFAIVVCDVNGLKQINDTLGHKAGDEHIKSACMIVCKLFKQSPVFRIGGDEFVVVLEGDDYENRLGIMKELNETVEENNRKGGVVIATGISDFSIETDLSFQQVFERADGLMYIRKNELKRMKKVT